MAQDRIAVVRGTFLKPGVSKNRRLYTRANIRSAVEGMKENLSSGTVPLTMFTSHAAADSDNVLHTIGRITKVAQEEDGSATFEADIANTTTGRDLAALVAPGSGQPYLKGISIRGAWTGDLKTVEQDGQSVTTADGLQVNGIDYTGRPGVEGAEVTYAALIESAGLGDMTVFEAAPDAEFFVEEVEEDDDDAEARSAAIAEAVAEALAPFLEAGNAPGNGKLPYGKVKYADPGYQGDKKKRYPIDTKEHVRAAWSFINQEKNQSGYTGTQVARIKSRIKTAAKKFDINIAGEAEQLIADIQDVLEAYASMCIDNGAGSISVSGYDNDAQKLPAMAARIAFAAMAGLNALDPDQDGDIDLGSNPTGSEATGNGTATSDDDMESEPASTSGETTADQTTEAPVAETTTSGAAATEARNFTDADIAALAAAMKTVAPATETAAPAPEPTQTAASEATASTDDVAAKEAEKAAHEAAIEKIRQEAYEKATADFTAKLLEQAREEGMAFRRGNETATGGSGATRTLEEMSPLEIANLDRKVFNKMAGELLMEHPAVQALTHRQIALGQLHGAPTA